MKYQCDGMVIKVNSLDQQRRLGATGKAPRGMVAFKFQPEQAVTKLVKIDLQVGKSGVLTPVARLEPVKLAGTTVQNATLHNFDEIARKDIRVGDEVVIEKAGEIIPQVVSVKKHAPGGKPPEPPKKCPVCGSPVEKDADGPFYRCQYGLCPAQLKQRIRYFATRAAMDIEGLGPALVELLVDGGLVKDIADLYSLKPAQLAELERMGDQIRGEYLPRDREEQGARPEPADHRTGHTTGRHACGRSPRPAFRRDGETGRRGRRGIDAHPRGRRDHGEEHRRFLRPARRRRKS